MHECPNCKLRELIERRIVWYNTDLGYCNKHGLHGRSLHYHVILKELQEILEESKQ